MHRDLKSPYQWNTEHDSPWQQVGKKALILLFLPSGVGSCQGNSIFESNLMKRVENNLELRSCSKDMSLSQSCLNTSFTSTVLYAHKSHEHASLGRTESNRCFPVSPPFHLKEHLKGIDKIVQGCDFSSALISTIHCTTKHLVFLTETYTENDYIHILYIDI